MTENDLNPHINNDPMEKETNLSITPRKLRKYFNVLQHEQDKYMLCIKQYRLLKFSSL